MAESAYCRSCAFMGLRGRINAVSETIVEAEPEYRRSPSEQVNIPARSLVPICVVGKRDFSREFGIEVSNRPPAGVEFGSASDLSSETAVTLNRILDRPQDCDEWLRYVEGYAPKQRREMVDRERERRMLTYQMRANLGIGLLAVIVAAAGIVAGAYFNLKAAEIQRSGQSIINIGIPTVSPQATP